MLLPNVTSAAPLAANAALASSDSRLAMEKLSATENRLIWFAATAIGPSKMSVPTVKSAIKSIESAVDWARPV